MEEDYLAALFGNGGVTGPSLLPSSWVTLLDLEPPHTEAVYPHDPRCWWHK